MYFYKIYLHVFFFQSAFSQTSSSISLKLRYMPRLMRKYALTLTALTLTNIEIVVGSHVQVAVGNN